MADEHAHRHDCSCPWIRTHAASARGRDPPPSNGGQTFQSRLLVCAAVFACWTAGIEARLVLSAGRSARGVWRRRANGSRSGRRSCRPSAARSSIATAACSPTASTPRRSWRIRHRSSIPEDRAPRSAHALDECDAARLRDISPELAERSRFEFVDRQVSPKAARRVAALKLPGIVLYKESRRYYPKQRAGRARARLRRRRQRRSGRRGVGVRLPDPRPRRAHHSADRLPAQSAGGRARSAPRRQARRSS